MKVDESLTIFLRTFTHRVKTPDLWEKVLRIKEKTPPARLPRL